MAYGIGMHRGFCEEGLKHIARYVESVEVSVKKVAFVENLNSGSTTTIILLLDGQILVTNIGDSKAFFCSENFQIPAEAKDYTWRKGIMVRNKNFELASADELVHLSVKELTRDHHPDRDDEKLRVESAGGNVFEWAGVPRVNGQLAVTRSIGELLFTVINFGVVSEPKLTDWQPLTVNDTYLVAICDGVFEKQSLQDVCDLLWEARSHHPTKLELSSAGSNSLADRIVSTAFERGSMDNMAAVCHIHARAPTTSQARLYHSMILSVFGSDHTLTVLFMGTHTRISQWVTHPGIALARTRLTSKFLWNPKSMSSQKASC
ncbi:hypothetical protein DVH24_033466 [Malus domestica]|uniref:PPM-type phosphatase domain-containing protein n=1 Tax=Malus domestica TaxID=3750 RepID=A0A498JAT2_MALDO|nr:hypothetical protein DVH24_033466 [Malus domestica]